MKFFIGILTGFFLMIGGLYGTATYLQSPRAQLNRCMNLYLENAAVLEKEPEVIDTMIIEGVPNIEMLIEKKCKFWISNGQQF